MNNTPPAFVLADALQWALSQIQPDMDPDHQAAMAQAEAALASVRSGRVVVTLMPDAAEADLLVSAIAIASSRRKAKGAQLSGTWLGILRDSASKAEAVTVISCT